MAKEDIYDFLIIGAGCTGYAAAMYAGRFNLRTLVVGETGGGTIILTDTVENYPGFRKLTGLELVEKLEEHAKDYPSVSFESDKVVDARENGSIFEVKTLGGRIFKSKTILIATGTEWRKLGVPGENEYSSKGVHYCALCDGALYKDKILGVVGGSDSAAKEALLLTQWAKKVYIFYRGEKIHPEPVNATRVSQNPKIEVVNLTNVKEIKGGKFVNRVILDRPYNGSEEFPLDGLFVEIGHNPLSELAVKLGVKVDERKEIIIDRESRTNVKGVYAAGDVVNTAFKQAITGVAEGVHAAYGAYQYVTNESAAAAGGEDGGKKGT
ncbi:FAD-dependent oxidoreductase [Candidatus Micrarchaeota archaeon]|nr:FAD-dependent oxidoreductase [Candidatus Micrarchaeota archaeon]